MTEKEKFISEILALVKQPLAGENPIIPTESQIAELQKADGVEDAILIANNFGWSDYVVQWSLNQPTDQQDSVATALQAALTCLLYTSPSPRDAHESRMPSSA